jgi:hypothetical protein
MKTISCNERTDPVARMVRDMTAKEFVEWMVEHHALPAGSASTVESNLREQYKWHRLQGRLDNNPTASLLATLFCLRASTKALNRPEEGDA